MKSILSATLIISVATMALYADVSIVSSSYQEQVKVAPSGEKVKSWVKSHKVVPGTVIRYVNSIENSGVDEAQKLVIDNPIPENMLYLPNTATCQSSCEVTYSADGGVSFHTPTELYIGVGQERHIARASEYTNIRWVVDALLASSQSYVEYQARLK